MRLDGQQEVQDLRLTREESAVVGIETEAYYWLKQKANGTICRLDLDYVKELVLALGDFCQGTLASDRVPIGCT